MTEINLMLIKRFFNEFFISIQLSEGNNNGLGEQCLLTTKSDDGNENHIRLGDIVDVVYGW